MNTNLIPKVKNESLVSRPGDKWLLISAESGVSPGVYSS